MRISLKEKGLTFDLSNFGTHFSASNHTWDRILRAQVRSFWFEYMRTVAIYLLPGLKAHLNRVLDRNQKFIEAACANMNADLFLDGSKDPHRLLYLQQSGLWDILVIRMTRDGRAQSHSARLKPDHPENFEDTVKEWKHTMQQIEHVCKYFPKNHTLHVKYEDLCQQPENTLTRVWDFLQLPPLKMNWEDIDLRSSEHHILGNSMRTRQTIRIRLDEKWREDVSRQELQLFNKLAGSINGSLGYDQSAELSH